MLLVSLLFSSLLLVTPPLILAGWVVLLIRIGPLITLFERVEILRENRENTSYKNRVWTVVAIVTFAIFVILCLVLDLLLLGKDREWQSSISNQNDYFSIVLSFLYSPIMSVLILEAWLVLVSYFVSQQGLYQFPVSALRRQWIGKFTVTTAQLTGILTGVIGFAWWGYIGITDQIKFDKLNNFALVELSPITVLLTFGLVILLFVLLRKISTLEDNRVQSEQVAGRMTVILLASLVVVSTIGGLLSILIHYDRSGWYGIGR